jgi:hypothetical protein
VFFKGVWTGVVTAVGGGGQVQKLVKSLSSGKVALGAYAGVEAGAYYALGDGAIATVAAATSEVVIPLAAGAYVGWRAYEGLKAANSYIEQSSSQCH